MTLEEAVNEWKTLPVTKIIMRVLQERKEQLQLHARHTNVDNQQYGQLQAYYNGRLDGIDEILDLEVTNDSIESSGTQGPGQA